MLLEDLCTPSEENSLVPSRGCEGAASESPTVLRPVACLGQVVHDCFGLLLLLLLISHIDKWKQSHTLTPVRHRLGRRPPRRIHAVR